MNKAEREVERAAMRVIDKRGQQAEADVVMDAGIVPRGSIAPLRKEDPLQKLLKNTLEFLFKQPEYFYILGMPRPARRKMERELAKLLTTVPAPRKVASVDKEPAPESDS